jgi:hypothetical protein
MGFGAMLLAWFALAVIVFALVGVAISIGVILLLLIPAIVIVGNMNPGGHPASRRTTA